jgi:Na+/H+-dicarboxylate symporter
MKMQTWHHWVLAIIIGYLLGYYFRQLGDSTVAKIVPPGLSGRAA